MKKIYLLLLAMVSLMVFGLSFNKVEAATITYSMSITTDDFNSNSYDANNNKKTTVAVNTADETDTLEVEWQSYQIMLFSGVMQWRKNNGYIYNITPINIESVTVTSTEGEFTTTYGTTENPSSGDLVIGTSTFFKIKVGGGTGKTSKVEVVFTVTTSEHTEAVKTVDAYMSLGFQYTENSTPAMLKKYQKITSLDELTTGTEVYLGAVTDNGAFISGGKDSGSTPKYLVVNQTKEKEGLLDINENAKALTVTKLDNGKFEFALDAETKLGATKSDLSFDNTNTEWTVAISETGETTITNAATEGVTNTIIKFNYNKGNGRFKTYSDTYEVPQASLYKEVEVPGYVVTYTDSQFVIKCGISKEKADALASFGSYGIYVKSGDEVRYYGSSESINVLVDETSGLYYVTISLGDVINNIGRATQTFEVGAFVKVDGEYVLSSNTKAYSVASIVKQYVEVENIDNPDVTDLYNLLADKDCYNA